MILPALYLQRLHHAFRYKRDTFDEAKRDFTQDQWMPIDIATYLRSSLPERYRPSRQFVFIAGICNKPGLLLKQALTHGKSKQALELTRKMAGKSFVQQTSDLLHSMRTKIADADAFNRSDPEDFLCAMGDVKTGPFIDEPFKATLADYVDAKKLFN